jgi:hypothetical protein
MVGGAWKKKKTSAGKGNEKHRQWHNSIAKKKGKKRQKKLVALQPHCWSLSMSGLVRRCNGRLSCLIW